MGHADGPTGACERERTDVASREDAGPILNGMPSQLPDIDPEETQEWLESLDGVGGRARAAPAPAT